MSYDIGNLEIQIISDATKATTGLDRFTNSLTQLSGAVNAISNTTALSSLATGIRDISNALSTMTVDGRAVNSLVNSLNKLNSITGANFGTVANNLSTLTRSVYNISGVAPQTAQDIRSLSSAIATLGSDRVQRAVTNMPILATALNNLMATLAQAPTVSQNLIDMTNALANLSASLGRTVNNSSSASSSFLRLSSTAKVATHSFKGFVSQIGMFYAKFFLLIRAIKKLWQSTETAMNFVETFNYWSVALNKISAEYETTFSDMGENSAESFAESYSDKLKTLTKKMTGFTLGNNGELTSEGSIGLGLDPNQLLEYQARIMGITNSVGLMGDASIATAKALSMLSADISSLTNTDLSTVMTNLQSGLVGQSRALYKYGIDITSATLKEIAMANGIEESVTQMSQSEKMQLRILAILQQSKVAWGDQANTINSVANQYRVLKQQVTNLGRIIGNVLLPVVKTVLPYLNAIIIVMQRLFTQLGYKLWGDTWLSDLNEDITAMATDDMEDYSDAVDDATDSVKKLKSQLLGIDELNNLTSGSDTDGSIVGSIGDWDLTSQIEDALSEYEKVWNDALKRAQNKAEILANKIMNLLTNFSPYQLGKKFAEKLNSVNWNEVSTNVAKFFTKAINKGVEFVAGVVDNLDFVAIGDGIADGINYAITNLKLERAFKNISKIAIGLLDALSTILKKVKWGELGEKIGNALSEIKWGTIFAKTAKVILQALYSALKLYYKAYVTDRFSVLMITGFALLKFTALGSVLGKSLKAVMISLATPIKEGITTALSSAFGTLASAGVLAPLGIVAIGVTVSKLIVKAIEKGIGESLGETLANALSTENLEEFSRNGVNSLDTINTLFSEKIDAIKGQFTGLHDALNNLSDTHVSLDGVTQDIDQIFKSLELGAYTAEQKVDEIILAFNNLKTQTQSIFQEEYDAIMLGLAGAVGDAYTAMGGDLDAIVQAMALAKADGDVALADVYVQMADLETKYQTGGISAEEYADAIKILYEKLSAFSDSDVTNQVAENIGVIENGVLDLTNMLGSDGGVDAEKLSAMFSELVQAMVDGTGDLAQTGIDYENTVKDIVAQMESLGVDTSTIDIEGLLSANTSAINANMDEYASAWEQYTNQIQVGLAEQLPSIIETATADYENLKWYEKLFTTKDDYVNQAVQNWQSTVVDPFAQEIQSSFETLGIEGTPWVSDAIQNMLDNSFTYVNEEETIRVLKGNWADIISGSLDDIESVVGMDSFAKDTLNGYANAITNSSNQETTKSAIQTWGDNLYQWFHDSKLKFGSPSQAMYDFGTDTLVGYANGLGDSTALSKVNSAISTFTQSVISKFSNVKNDFKTVGENIVQGIVDGISGKLPSLEDIIKDLVDKVKNGVEDGLDINSPSKVMYALGEFTTEGFKDGMESLYSDTTKSLKNFTGELASAPNTKMSVGFMSNANVSAVNSANIYPAIYDAMVSALSSTGGNTNVNVTLQGGAEKIFTVVREENNKFARRTGNSAFA